MNKLFKLLRKKYSTVKIGEGHTKQLYLTNEKNEKLSFWHDL
jgi:hypothetical protein